MGYLSKFIWFPLSLKKAKEWADVVHVCDHAYSLYSRFLQGVAHVVTCHDLIAVRTALGEFEGQRTRWTGRAYQQMIVGGLNHAKHVACVSEATRRDVLRVTK